MSSVKEKRASSRESLDVSRETLVTNDQQLTPPPSIHIEGERLKVHFDTFSIDAYRLFLKAKALPEFDIEFKPESETYEITAPARFAALLGAEVPRPAAADLPMPDFLFDDQRELVTRILEAKRFAYWGDCGLGKTLVGLEAARQIVHRTGGRVLLFTLNEIVPGWIEEAQRFYGDGLQILRLETRDQMRAWARGEVSGVREQGSGEESLTPETCNLTPQIAITNYEKMNFKEESEQTVSELKYLAGVILDESDRLKGGGGKQKWALIKSCKGIEYKLSLTATPAPNDTMEFASQASFLEKMRSEGDIIWTYFQRNEKTHRWEVKRHARQAFFQFMSSWSIYVRDPRRYGWRQNFADVPEPEYFQHDIPMTPEQRTWLAKLSSDPAGQMSMFDAADRNAIDRNKLAQVARGFAYTKGEAAGKFVRVASHKPLFVAELVRDELAAGHQVLVWTVFDAESELICEHLARMGVEHDTLHGSTKPDERQLVRDRFRTGRSQCLVTKPSLLGYGQNFQMCTSNVFSGFNDSYVQFYQAVRRSVRYGQTQRVRVHLPLVPELEGDMLENLYIKRAKHEADIAEMEANYIAAMGRGQGTAN